jgi:hypothetical protein
VEQGQLKRKNKKRNEKVEQGNLGIWMVLTSMERMRFGVDCFYFRVLDSYLWNQIITI